MTESQGAATATATSADFIATDVQAEMFDQNSSMYVRIPFSTTDPARFNQLSLEYPI